MNQISRGIKQIESEIQDNIIEFYNNSTKYSRAVIGETATLAQVANHIAPQFGLSPSDILNLFMTARRLMNERTIG